MTAEPMETDDPMDAPTGRIFHGARCSARSRQSGVRCGNPAIPGGNVCRFHGGNSPQVRAKAQLRLVELIEPAIATLQKEMESATTSQDRQRAANSILDRAGVARRTEVDHGAAQALLIERLQELVARRLGEVTVDTPPELVQGQVVERAEG